MLTSLRFWWHCRKVDAVDKPAHYVTNEEVRLARAKAKTSAAVLGSLRDPRAIEPLVKAWDLLEASATQALQCMDQAQLLETLIRTLTSPEPRHRINASRLLAKFAEDDAVHLLISQLGDRDSDVRIVVTQLVGKLGGASAVGPLLDVLRDTDWKVRQCAAKELGEIGDSSAVEALIGALEDRERGVRCFAAAALGQIGDVRAVSPLISILGDCDGNVRREAAKALAGLGEYSWMGWVSGEDGSSDILGLRRCGDARALEPLILALGRSHSLWAATVARELGFLDDTRVVEPLIRALGDGDRDVRASAASALGELSDSRSLDPLVRALGDEEPSVGAAACIALGQLGDRSAVQPLIRMLVHYKANVRRCAAAALTRLGEPSWVKWVKGESDDFEGLGNCGDQRALDLLLLALEDFRTDRRAVAEALGQLGDVRAVQPLIQTLGASNPDVRRAAAAALGRLGEPTWVHWIKGTEGDITGLEKSGDARALGVRIRLLENRLRDSDWEKRKSAARALVSIAVQTPQALQGRWEDIAERVRRPYNTCHDDETMCRSHSDNTINYGVGMEFPDPPNQEGDAKKDF